MFTNESKKDPRSPKKRRERKKASIRVEVEYIADDDKVWDQIFALLEKGKVKDGEDKDDPDGLSLIQQNLF